MFTVRRVIRIAALLFAAATIDLSQASAAETTAWLNYRTTVATLDYDIQVAVVSTGESAKRIVILARHAGGGNSVFDQPSEWRRLEVLKIDLPLRSIVLPAFDPSWSQNSEIDPQAPNVRFDKASMLTALKSEGVFIVSLRIPAADGEPAEGWLSLIDIPAALQSIDIGKHFLTIAPVEAGSSRRYFVQRLGSPNKMAQLFGSTAGASAFIFSALDVSRNGAVSGSGTGLIVSSQYHHLTDWADWTATGGTWRFRPDQAESLSRPGSHFYSLTDGIENYPHLSAGAGSDEIPNFRPMSSRVVAEALSPTGFPVIRPRGSGISDLFRAFDPTLRAETDIERIELRATLKWDISPADIAQLVAITEQPPVEGMKAAIRRRREAAKRLLRQIGNYQKLPALRCEAIFLSAARR